MLWQQKLANSLKCRCNCLWSQQFAFTGDIQRLPAARVFTRAFAESGCAVQTSSFDFPFVIEV